MVLCSYLLCVMWLLTRWPAARAAISESSPASTVAHTTLASCRALSPGHSWLAPCTPSICTYTNMNEYFRKLAKYIVIHEPPSLAELTLIIHETTELIGNVLPTFRTKGQLIGDGLLGTKAVSPIWKKQIFGSVVRFRIRLVMVMVNLKEKNVSLSALIPGTNVSVVTGIYRLQLRSISDRNMTPMCVLACVCVYLEAGLLGGQAGSSSYSAQLYGWHGASDVQVLSCWSWRLHQGDAVTAAHWLGWILENTHTQPRTLT